MKLPIQRIVHPPLRPFDRAITEMRFHQPNFQATFILEGGYSTRVRHAICLIVFRTLKPLFRIMKARIQHVDQDRRAGFPMENRQPSLRFATRLTTPTDQRGSAIRIRRLINGWTQRELADRARISLSHLSRIEHGKYVPRMGTLYRIEACLDAAQASTVCSAP